MCQQYNYSTSFSFVLCPYQMSANWLWSHQYPHTQPSWQNLVNRSSLYSLQHLPIQMYYIIHFPSATLMSCSHKNFFLEWILLGVSPLRSKKQGIPKHPKQLLHSLCTEYHFTHGRVPHVIPKVYLLLLYILYIIPTMYICIIYSIL